jgi:hypothetical protein
MIGGEVGLNYGTPRARDWFLPRRRRHFTWEMNWAPYPFCRLLGPHLGYSLLYNVLGIRSHPHNYTNTLLILYLVKYYYQKYWRVSPGNWAPHPIAAAAYLAAGIWGLGFISRESPGGGAGGLLRGPNFRPNLAAIWGLSRARDCRRIQAPFLAAPFQDQY